MSMNPLDVFNSWYNEAEEAQVVEPFSFVLSTVKDGQPRSRVLFWRRLYEGVFYFFTNYGSDKGKEIENNSKVAMNFHWRLPIHRQVRIQGTITKAAKEISDDYFSKRPRGSQLGAWASPQSRAITGHDELEKLVNEMTERFKGKDVPRPEFWGGYAITPDYFEFWEEGESRLHNRTVFVKDKNAWTQRTIAP